LGLKTLSIVGVDAARALWICHADPKRLSPAATDLLEFFRQRTGVSGVH